ncbi:MAG: restriction endonuclease [Fulvivirga sp.]
MITNLTPDTWRDLQTEVGRILEQCGFSVEIEKKAATARGRVELDVYAEETIKGRKYSIACECKHWKANVPQTIIHGFRTVVSDLGCNIGYIITTSDFQSGSLAASEMTNVELMTWENFQNKFFESWYEEYFSPSIAKELDPILTYSEPILPKWFSKMTSEEKDTYYELKDKYDAFGWIVMMFTPYARMVGNKEIPTLPLISRLRVTDDLKKNIPTKILNETGYKQFMEHCIEFGNIAISEFRVLRDKYI